MELRASRVVKRDDKHGAEVGVDWVNGLVIHENCAQWHEWDSEIYGEKGA